jgi:hypothetical protein
MPPTSWIGLAIACSLLSIAYVLSLLVLDGYGASRGLYFTSAQPATALVLPLWFAVLGLSLTICNIASVLRMLTEPLQVRDLWLTIKQKWPHANREASHLLVRGARFYADGRVDFLQGRRLGQSACRLFGAIRNWAARPSESPPSTEQAEQPYFALQRKNQEWHIVVPQRPSDPAGQAVVVRRPWVKESETIGYGQKKRVHAGYVAGYLAASEDATSEAKETWYVLIERTYP